MNGSLFLESALLVLGVMTALWLLSVFLKNASIVDPAWSILYLIIAFYCAQRTGWTAGKTLLVVLVALWALRLGLHLLLRGLGHGEDPRYAAFRQQFGPERYWWVSFFQVFVLQGILALLISAPLQMACTVASPDPISTLDIIGAAVFALGFSIEAIADWQLQRFRNNPDNRGTILNTGLWRYSRHPNYFGDALLWWGFWICALDTPWGFAAVLAPILMTFLLLKVSGVVMLDKILKKTKPGYDEYIQKTSSFIPLPPRD